MKISNLDYFWHKVDVASSFLDKDDALMTQMLENLLNEIALHSELANDSDYYHLKGYIYYSMRPQKLHEAKSQFEKSLELDASNAYSKLYLGHSYYDLGDYQNAQNQFSAIAENSLPDWLMMKVNEMVVCCKFKMFPDLAEPDIQDFLKKYASIDYLNDYPFELSNLLKQEGRNLEKEGQKYQ